MGSSRLEECRLLERIGRGSFGKVFRGELRDPSMGIDQCAVKVCDVDDERDKEVVLREVALLRRAHVHKNVVRFFGVLGLGNSVQVYLELCLCSLADLVRERSSPLPEFVICASLHSVAEALCFLHGELNTVHRDIKGANILLSTSGVIKLTDFNVSATLSTQRPACASATGTPQWMAPEVIMGEPYGPPADMWSLGVTLLELADGTVPHYSLDPMAAMFRIVTNPAPSLREPEAHSILFDLLARALLVKNAHGRPTAAQLLGHECMRATGTESERSLVLCQLAFEYQQYQALATPPLPSPASLAGALDAAKRMGNALARDPLLDAERKRLRGPHGAIRLSDCPPIRPSMKAKFACGSTDGPLSHPAELQRCGSSGPALELLEGLNPTGLCLSTPPTLVDMSGSSWDGKPEAWRTARQPGDTPPGEFHTNDPGTTPPPTRADGASVQCSPVRGSAMEADFVDGEGDAFIVMPRGSHISTRLCSTTVVVVEDYML